MRSGNILTLLLKVEPTEFLTWATRKRKKSRFLDLSKWTKWENNGRSRFGR